MYAAILHFIARLAMGVPGILIAAREEECVNNTPLQLTLRDYLAIHSIFLLSEALLMLLAYYIKNEFFGVLRVYGEINGDNPPRFGVKRESVVFLLRVWVIGMIVVEAARWLVWFVLGSVTLLGSTECIDKPTTLGVFSWITQLIFIPHKNHYAMYFFI